MTSVTLAGYEYVATYTSKTLAGYEYIAYVTAKTLTNSYEYKPGAELLGYTYSDAVLFLDGFDYYANPAEKWSTATNVGVTGNALTPTGSMALTQTFSPSPVATIGFAIKRLTTDTLTFTALSGATPCLSVTLNANGTLTTGSTTSAYALPLNRFAYLEIHFNLTGSVVIQVNGTERLNVTGLTSGAATTDQISITGGAVGSVVIDHLYILSGDNRRFLGPCRIDTLNPNANSTPQDWIPDTGNAWERVASTPGHISTSTVGAESRFTLTDLDHTPTTIHAVQFNALASGDGDLILVADAQVLSETERNIRETFIDNPATSLAWAVSEVNGLTAGVEAA